MRRNMADMEIIEVTSDAITVKLGPDDVRAISNSLNEMCNGIGWDALNEWNFTLGWGSFAGRPARCSVSSTALSG